MNPQATISPPWHVISESSGDGIAAYRLPSWSHFFDFIENVVCAPSTSSKHGYIWRGQRCADWSLSSSLDRLFERMGLLDAGARVLEEQAATHLRTLKFAARGRRGQNPPRLEDNEWWALGQHYGLASPLLDWTRAPFAAAYFAFEELSSDQTPYRVVFGLNRDAVQAKNAEFEEGQSLEVGRLPIVEFIEPLSDENPRLVSQSGLFTRAPIGMPIEGWIAQAFEGSGVPALLRIEIPNRDRGACLRGLDRMNINHLSLFPDLAGASRFANIMLELGR